MNNYIRTILEKIEQVCEEDQRLETLFETNIADFIRYLNGLLSKSLHGYARIKAQRIKDGLDYAGIEYPDEIFAKCEFTITGKQLESKGKDLSSNPWPRNAVVKPESGECVVWGSSGYGQFQKVRKPYFKTAQEAQEFLDKFITLPKVMDREKRIGHIEWKVAKTRDPELKIKINTECGECYV